ncbi:MULTISPECIES: methionine--tRNA ligase [unclassified Streptomyces]|uniref:methionine--tRNA ligase n=1 Tax=unclassified Streptomyces TaxID=2593676 RepID=UPI002365E919|nr:MULTISPECIES: methionine--tRNA ligase [unclassified Streptomyces]MDF3142523.1 methionine--tRNA ligase [Streptomyces sp. T21Q-yed]WDF39733.1 methionine--tRNA ligase [Streptomyces sp. T12]
MARHLITSALPYINGIKHLGNMVGSMLPADVYSRYLRQRGHDVLYICATDEHGTPAELAAKEQGVPVDEFCAQAHDQQKAIYDGFNLAFDYFGRSSSPQNHEITQEIARELKANGFIEERAIRQVYSITDGRFLPDRYIIGTCPHCGYDKARGDQCENCTRVLDPTDLIDARSAISGSSDLEVRETKHLFLLQSVLADEVEAWVDERADNWPVLASSIARKWLTEGLHDRAITRDLDWGVPVPADTWPDLAAEGKVFYVWFDAPIEYIGSTKEWADQDPENRDWRSWWWESDADVHYTQFMGKDNVPFHSVMFPATLLGTRAPWKKVDVIKAFNWLNYYGGKFSTSQKRGVFTHDALEILPADYWRYFMMANAPESDDSSFTWEHFTATVNKDLADTLGNFVNRVLSFSRKRFGDEVPAGAEPGEAEARLGEEIARLLAEYEEHMEAIQFRKAAAALRALWSAGNSYLEEKAPWLEIKTDKDGAALTLRTAMNLIHLYAVVSEPFIPATAKTMREAFALSDDTATWVGADEAKSLTSVPAGTPFTVPPVLFAKLTDEDLETYKERFGGE